MAGSLGVQDIERVVIAAVRAALQGVAPPVQSTYATVSTPAVPSASGTSNFATTVTSLRSGEHTLISKEDIEGLLLLVQPSANMAGPFILELIMEGRMSSVDTSVLRVTEGQLLDATPPSRCYFLLDQSQPEYYR
ncbi:unnamed protein product [Gadus morhua 'NCC']